MAPRITKPANQGWKVKKENGPDAEQMKGGSEDSDVWKIYIEISGDFSKSGIGGDNLYKRGSQVSSLLNVYL